MRARKPKTILRKIAVHDLVIHPYAQRRLVPAKLKRLTEELDLDAIGVIHAVQYEADGRRPVMVIDGQHRIEALRAHDFGEWVVDVKIHLDADSDAKACGLFLKLNDRSPVGPFDRFENERRAGESDAVAVVAIARRYGLRVERHQGDGVLCAVAALKTVYAHDHGRSLATAFHVIQEAWGFKTAALEGKILEGLGLVLHRYAGEIEERALVTRLAKAPGGPARLLGDARGRREIYGVVSIAHCVARAMIDLYNRGRRSGKLEPF